MENVPLFNSRILNTYVEYIRSNYPQVNIESALQESGITIYELEDGGHWFTQKQADVFYEVLRNRTGRSDLAREAGRFVAISQASSLLRQYALGFLSPDTAYSLLEKLALNLTRSSTFRTRKIGPETMEVIACPQPGAAEIERPYQCENRTGMLECLAMPFTNKFARVEHPICIHHGGEYCMYIVHWDKTPSFAWKRIRNVSSLLAVIFLAAGFYPLSFPEWLFSAFAWGIIIAGLAYFTEHLEKKELMANVQNQGIASEQLLEQINMRYKEAKLVKEIGQATSRILDTDKLLAFFTEALGSHLDFDRGMIMLANKERTRLVYSVGYGYNPQYESYLKKIEFRLDNPQSRGVAVEAFRKQVPFLVNDISEIEESLSSRSLEFARRMGAKSFVCLPIVYEGESIGVLFVDNLKSKRRMSQSDISLLMGIAPQIGISINNALSYKMLQQSEERFRSLSENAPDIIYTLSENGVFTYVNPAWEKILGHSPEEVLGKQFVDFCEPQERYVYVYGFSQIRDKKQTITDHAGSLIGKGGSLRLFSMSGAPNTDAEGNVIGMVGTLKDITDRKRAEEALQTSYEKLKLAMESTIQAISTIVETRDPYTSGHQERVARLACAIARDMGISEGVVAGIRMAARIHDIGKLYIPAEILSKPSTLNKIEFEMIKTHAQIGYNILKNIEFPQPVARIVLQHHERLNGSGYPYGLRGDEIMVEAGIIAVADTVEAMMFHRPYRPALGINKALQEITDRKGQLYLATAVDACIRLFQDNRFRFDI